MYIWAARTTYSYSKHTATTLKNHQEHVVHRKCSQDVDVDVVHVVELVDAYALVPSSDCSGDQAS